MIKHNIILTLLLFFNFYLNAQELPLQFEKEFTIETVWEDYSPDLYNVGDSLLYSIGLSTIKREGNTFQNVCIRAIHLNGALKYEEHIRVIKDTVPFGGYLLSTYYGASCYDGKHFYVITTGDLPDCSGDSSILSAVRILKIDLLGEVVKDTLICSPYYLFPEDMILHPNLDSLYISMSRYDENWQSSKIISRFSTSFQDDIIDRVIKTVPSSFEQLSFSNDTLRILGSSYPRTFSSSVNPDIWFGYISNGSLFKDKVFRYFDRFVFRRSFQLEENEMAVRASQKDFSAFQESIYLFRNDSLIFNYYDAHSIELSDFLKVDSNYLLIKSSYRENDAKEDGIVLQNIDQQGYPGKKKFYTVPWIQFYLNGIEIRGHYFSAIKIWNGDIASAFVRGEIDPEEHSKDYTHFIKFRINE